MYFSLIGYWDKIFCCIPCKIYKIKKILLLVGYFTLGFFYMPNFPSESRKILLLEGIREEFSSIYPKWFKEKDKSSLLYLNYLKLHCLWRSAKGREGCSGILKVQNFSVIIGSGVHCLEIRVGIQHVLLCFHAVITD